MSLISIDYKRYWHCRSGVVGWVASCPLIGKRTGKASVRASCVADVQRMHRQCRIGYMRRGSAWNMPSAFAVAKVSTYATSRSALQHRHLVAAQGQDIDAIRSEEHTSELQSLMRISYAVFCLKKKTKNNKQNNTREKKRQRKSTTQQHKRIIHKKQHNEK